VTSLTDFLLARIAEDETVARAGRNADVIWPIDAALGVVRTGEDVYLASTPDRVLAECEAKRHIVAMAAQLCYGNEEEAGWDVLALPYADHPDYRDEWRP